MRREPFVEEEVEEALFDDGPHEGGGLIGSLFDESAEPVDVHVYRVKVEEVCGVGDDADSAVGLGGVDEELVADGAHAGALDLDDELAGLGYIGYVGIVVAHLDAELGAVNVIHVIHVINIHVINIIRGRR